MVPTQQGHLQDVTSGPTESKVMIKLALLVGQEILSEIGLYMWNACNPTLSCCYDQHSEIVPDTILTIAPSIWTFVKLEDCGQNVWLIDNQQLTIFMSFKSLIILVSEKLRLVDIGHP